MTFLGNGGSFIFRVMTKGLWLNLMNAFIATELCNMSVILFSLTLIGFLPCLHSHLFTGSELLS